MKKKILYVHHGKGVGGAPLSLLYLVQALDKNQYDPVVLFLHHSDAFDLFRSHNITILGPVNRYDFPHTTIWWLRWYHLPFFIKSLWDTFITTFYTAHYWIKKINPDLIHLNTSSLIAWGIAARYQDIPVVWHIRELLAAGYFGIRNKVITTIIGKCASLIIPICKHDAQPWAGNKKVRVIYNAAQKTRFDYTISPVPFLKQHHLDANIPKILFLGGLSYEKGTNFILEVFTELLQQKPNAQLLIAGYCDLATQTPSIKKYFPAHKFKKTVTDRYHKIQHAVTLLGPINNVPEAMAASDIIVFPALVGHFARPIIEAGFMKKPVIASNKPPLNELVIDKKTGFLIDPNDTAAWISHVMLLLDNKTLRTTMGEAAYQFALQNFSIEQQIINIQQAYQRLL